MERTAITPEQAQRLLEGTALAPVVQAGLSEAKEILSACLDGGVPALLGRDDHCTKGCSPKVMLLARAEDAGRIHEILQARWAALLDPEAAFVGAGREVAEGEPPCPACGTSAALVDGACVECGLQLG